MGKTSFKRIVGGILDGLFESRYNCLCCGRELAGDNGFALCNFCMGALVFVGKDACLRCGKPIYDEAQYCPVCRERERKFDRAFAPLLFTKESANLIYGLKFNGKRYYAPYLASFLVDKILECGIVPDVVVPVPLHVNRKKQRGYNQSGLLAEQVAKRLHLPQDGVNLIRARDTAAQTTLGGEARQKNVQGAFAVRDKSAFKGKNVLLIDDVMTTGATAEACAECLKSAKAASVTLLTLVTVPSAKAYITTALSDAGQP